MSFLQFTIDGILLGAIYAAVAVGFSLVWGIMNIVNLAHGAFVMLGGYITLGLFTLLGLDPFLALPFTMLVLFGIGWLTQTLLINRIIRAPLLITFLLTFALALIIADVMLQLFTASYRSVTPVYASVGVHIGGVVIPLVRAAVLLVAVLMAMLLNWFLSATRSGQAILATGMDVDAARLVGINVARVFALTFAIGAALAGAAGDLISIVYPLAPNVGDPFTLRAFVVVVLGGLGNVYGALLGGLVFGLVETYGAAGLGTGLEDAIAFGVLVVMLVLRPRGLIGRAYYQ
jgi:branched-chain amino acid transport system permease protein